MNKIGIILQNENLEAQTSDLKNMGCKRIYNEHNFSLKEIINDFEENDELYIWQNDDSELSISNIKELMSIFNGEGIIFKENASILENKVFVISVAFFINRKT